MNRRSFVALPFFAAIAGAARKCFGLSSEPCGCCDVEPSSVEVTFSDELECEECNASEPEKGIAYWDPEKKRWEVVLLDGKRLHMITDRHLTVPGYTLEKDGARAMLTTITEIRTGSPPERKQSQKDAQAGHHEADTLFLTQEQLDDIIIGEITEIRTGSPPDEQRSIS